MNLSPWFQVRETGRHAGETAMTHEEWKPTYGLRFVLRSNHMRCDHTGNTVDSGRTLKILQQLWIRRIGEDTFTEWRDVPVEEQP